MLFVDEILGLAHDLGIVGVGLAYARLCNLVSGKPWNGKSLVAKAPGHLGIATQYY
jgi:hypothetical protein